MCVRERERQREIVAEVVATMQTNSFVANGTTGNDATPATVPEKREQERHNNCSRYTSTKIKTKTTKSSTTARNSRDIELSIPFSALSIPVG